MRVAWVRVRSIEHIGSAHDDAEPAVLKEVARQRLNASQLSLNLPGLNSTNKVPVRSELSVLNEGSLKHKQALSEKHPAVH